MSNTLNFYDVSKDYVAYLQESEKEKRGFTKVPNMEYPGRKQKFLCGIVLQVNGMDYYVPITSHKKQHSESILIYFKNQNDPVGSLRFNFMIPIPKEMATYRDINNEADPKHRVFLAKEHKFIIENKIHIFDKAEKTYQLITQNKNPKLNENSCDFKFLEKRCLEYCIENNLEIPCPFFPKTLNPQNPKNEIIISDAEK
ncbi:Endoribonuclease ToxN [Methanosarcinaceae archaeon Ag5]|uniref:Endoribonuclease ToxN n=1 Tax=Methanolapillus africanus TaxID=3028297 RepID=A0AAE4SDD5_9EURY|nr:Endoribonuclease ToxN [Methanosarcinaceae archaeon Ag5]